MSEPLWVPDSELKHVIAVLEAGCEHATAPQGTKRKLLQWCKEMTAYLKRMETDS